MSNKTNKLTAQNIIDLQHANAHKQQSIHAEYAAHIDWVVSKILDTIKDLVTSGSIAQSMICSSRWVYDIITDNYGVYDHTDTLSFRDAILDELKDRGFNTQIISEGEWRVLWNVTDDAPSEELTLSNINASIGALHDKVATLDRVDTKLNLILKAIDAIEIQKSHATDLRPVINGIADVKKTVKDVSDKATTNEYLIRGLDCY